MLNPSMMMMMMTMMMSGPRINHTDFGGNVVRNADPRFLNLDIDPMYTQQLIMLSGVGGHGNPVG